MLSSKNTRKLPVTDGAANRKYCCFLWQEASYHRGLLQGKEGGGRLWEGFSLCALVKWLVRRSGWEPHHLPLPPTKESGGLLRSKEVCLLGLRAFYLDPAQSGRPHQLELLAFAQFYFLECSKLTHTFLINYLSWTKRFESLIKIISVAHSHS